jgi:non-homologous end joining protein Ku
MAYTAWRGAVEIKVNGFPIPVNIALEPRTSKLKPPSSFRLVSPEGEAVGQTYITDDDSWRGSVGECARAIENDEGKWVVLDNDTISAIRDSERSTLVEPDSFAPIDTLDLATAHASFAVQPDSKQPGAERQVEVVWNGLRYAKLAYITRIVMRGGALDGIVAIYADEHGLWAVTMPFEAEIKADVKPAVWEANDEVGAMFAQAIEASYEVKPYDPADHPSVHHGRQVELLKQALAGNVIEAPKPEPTVEVPDLMAALAASAKQIKGKGKGKAKQKVAA